MIDKGKIYTTGNTFRAKAERYARHYRANILRTENYDRYGHILTDDDANQGLNFLPSLRFEIFNAVKLRSAQGKGVDLGRTSKNLLSSQAMCFNLFVPLNINKNFTTKLLSVFVNSIQRIEEDIVIEYTPSNKIFNDQSGRGGVDCDALSIFKNEQGEESVLVIETKFVEPEFSNCGFSSPKKKPRCPVNTIVSDDFSSCNYSSKKRYKYWEVASESGAFNMDLIRSRKCPFRSNLWQLWTNLSLAYGIAQERGMSDYHYAVICPKNNAILANRKNNESKNVYDQFRECLSQPERFHVIYLEDIFVELLKEKKQQIGDRWIEEFCKKYDTVSKKL